MTRMHRYRFVNFSVGRTMCAEHEPKCKNSKTMSESNELSNLYSRGVK